MMDDIWHAIGIAPVGPNADVPGKYNNIPALPLCNVGHIRRQGNGCVLKIDIQIGHAPEIDVVIRAVNAICRRIFPNICIIY